VKIEEIINGYLIKRFIGEPKDLPKDECLREAKHILSLVHQHIPKDKVKAVFDVLCDFSNDPEAECKITDTTTQICQLFEQPKIKLFEMNFKYASENGRCLCHACIGEVEPADKQIQWFWEQCGIENRFEGDTGTWYYHYPDGQCDIESPPIDLNNLFKYAVPKLELKFQYLLRSMGSDGHMARVIALHPKPFTPRVKAEVWNKDPALALFWAIYRAFGGEE
jgi:hypothetical protein